MFDSLTIFAVTIAVIFVTIRAMGMDSRLPWFKPRSTKRAPRKMTREDWE